MITIQKANKTFEFKIIEELAFKILHEVYNPIIPSDHTDFFLKQFQSDVAIKHQIEKQNFEYFLLNFNKQSVGYLGVQLLDKRLILSKLYILKSFRGKKIGKTALAFVHQFAVENESKKIELIVNQQNQNTITIYKKNGYKIVESIVNSFPNGHDIRDYRMEKIL